MVLGNRYFEYLQVKLIINSIQSVTICNHHYELNTTTQACQENSH